MDTCIPLAKLKQNVDLRISEQTIHCRLDEVGIRKWKALKCALLTEQHASAHLKWAKAHENWTLEDWAHVIWSDECAVQHDSDPC